MIEHLIQKQDIEDRNQILLMASNAEPPKPVKKVDDEDSPKEHRRSVSTMH